MITIVMPFKLSIYWYITRPPMTNLSRNISYDRMIITFQITPIIGFPMLNPVTEKRVFLIG